MELVKKNIHMDRTKAEAVSQITLEDDLNIPEQKPDVDSICFQKGSVWVEEIKPMTDSVILRGRLKFQMLYHTKETGSSLVLLEGGIPFEEKLNMQGVSATDTVSAQGETEDLSISLINSRKLNIQSVITLTAKAEELYDEEIPIALPMLSEESVEYCKTPVKLAEIAICKNDIFRIREEVSLPNGYPNFFQILWSSVTLGDMEWKVTSEKIILQGEVHIFVLYEGEGEEHPVRTFESVIPFGGSLECHGCREGMIADICYEMEEQEHTQFLSIRPDMDGEERNLGLEIALNIFMKLYEEDDAEMITDIYGVSGNVETVSEQADLRRLLARVNGKTKVTDHIRIKNADGILQLLHSEGSVAVEEESISENGILIKGSLLLNTLYITGNDEAPYGSRQAQIPFQYTLEVPGIQKTDIRRVHAKVEQLQTTMLDGEEMDVKAVLEFSTTVFRIIPVGLIQEIRISEPDSSVFAALPGMAVYVVRPGDNLWSIGRKYYVPTDNLRKINHLEKDELTPGQKLLVVRGS